MRIAVASGKGGTGKTTIAASLALSLTAAAASPPLFLDCDVEAPDAHLFLHPVFDRRIPVDVPVPVVDDALCNHCGKCAEVCQYHAIVTVGKQTLVFPQLCHGCGACAYACPQGAICERPHPLGVIELGPADAGITFGRGLLDIGAPMAVPVIRRLHTWPGEADGRPVIVDCPPGTSCPMVAALRGADFVLLVTEPTPFGLHDLRLAAQVASDLNIPAGVIINRHDGPDPDLEAFCTENDLPVLMRIPFERQIAAGIARGKNLVEIHPEYVRRFQVLYERLNAYATAVPPRRHPVENSE